MSAYIVDVETIDRIVTYLEKVRNEHEWLYLETCRAAGVMAAQANTHNELGQALYRMNVAAVDCRYEERNAIPMYRHTSRFAPLVQVYKTIQCYLYQCSEGDVPEQPLYKALEQLHRYCADRLISNLPEYEKAAWA